MDSHGLKRQLNQMGLCIVGMAATQNWVWIGVLTVSLGGIGLGIIIWIAGIERAWAPSLLPYVSGNAIFAMYIGRVNTVSTSDVLTCAQIGSIAGSGNAASTTDRPKQL